MKKILLISVLLFTLFSCEQTVVKSEKEIALEQTEAIVMKTYEAQVSGDIALFKSLLSDDFTYTLNGQLDISKTYDWDSFIEMQKYFGSLLKGEVGAEFKGIIVGVNEAVVFADGRMEGVGGKYENEYALKYVVDPDGKISSIKEWLSDLLLTTQLYGQEVCGEKKSL